MSEQGSTHPGANPAVRSDESGELLRPARALLGWLTDETAGRLLSSGQAGATLTSDSLAKLASARTAVDARSEGVDQTGMITEWPTELRAHEAALRTAAQPMFGEGWELRLVDISRASAFQPVVFTDHALERTRGVSADDMAGLAELTVPATVTTPLRASFDEARNAWVLVSANPNLRLVGHFSTPIPGAPSGTQGFGFLIGVLPSRLQVARFDGRYYLRDGYHRALGLLAAGITKVPAFVRDITAIEELVPPAMLPQAAYTGQRPPTLPDYLNDDVAADIRLPASQRMALVQGLELSFLS